MSQSSYGFTYTSPCPVCGQASGDMMNGYHVGCLRLSDEVVRLREQVDALTDALGARENARLRAELAAERERVEDYKRLLRMPADGALSEERAARERAETECERLQSEVYDLQTMLSDMSAGDKP